MPLDGISSKETFFTLRSYEVPYIAQLSRASREAMGHPVHTVLSVYTVILTLDIVFLSIIVQLTQHLSRSVVATTKSRKLASLMNQQQ